MTSCGTLTETHLIWQMDLTKNRHLNNRQCDGYPIKAAMIIPSIAAYLRLMVGSQKTLMDLTLVINGWYTVLSRTFLAQINVELCNSVKSIKHICKYVNKGNDQAAFELEKEWDEVSKYEAGRYISSSKAIWRILYVLIHKRFLPVMHLSVHLENGQRIYFIIDNAAEKSITLQNHFLGVL